MTAGDEDVMGTVGGAGPSTFNNATLTASEKKRVGKVYQKDQPLDAVVAAEMARIRQAFDKRVVDHTEELVNKVQTGQPLNPNKSIDSAGKKK